MTWDDMERRSLYGALLPTSRHAATFDNDPEFHAFITGLVQTLPLIIDWALEQAPGRAEARRRLMEKARSGLLPDLDLIFNPHGHEGPHGIRLHRKEGTDESR